MTFVIPALIAELYPVYMIKQTSRSHRANI